MLNKLPIFICVSAIIASCTVVTPEASKVMLYKAQTGNFLDGCERLGSVSGTGSGWKPRWKMDGWKGVSEDAKNNMRENAYRQYHADSVMLINVDRQSTSIVAQGIAYRCNH